MCYIVALTGGIGSGKNTVANIFSALHIPLVDADVISRQIVNIGTSVLYKITNYFGPTIINQDGSLNRILLKEKIFNNSQDRMWLNNYLHPIIQQQTERQFNYFLNSPYVVWIIPLLIENNLQKYANRILVVDVDPNLQISRTLIRDCISRNLINKIMMTQVSRQQRLSYANDIINNNGSQEELINHVTNLHYLYLKLSYINNKNRINLL